MDNVVEDVMEKADVDNVFDIEFGKYGRYPNNRGNTPLGEIVEYTFDGTADIISSTFDGGTTTIKEGSNTEKLFKNQTLLEDHYQRNGQKIADVLGESDCSIHKHLDDANYIINNGTYVPELNGYVRFMSGKKYGFVGLDCTTGDITTFHIKNVSELIKRTTSLGIEK